MCIYINNKNHKTYQENKLASAKQLKMEEPNWQLPK